MLVTVPTIAGFDLDDLWMRTLEFVLVNGSEVSPRGFKTREVIGLQLRLNDLRANVLDCPLRDLNYRFAVAEWLWIQSGLDDVATIAKYNSKIAQFSDDGEKFAGAYGPRLLPQLPWVIEQLKKEDSRQAVASIWTPCPARTKDVPCTLSFQWLLRGGKLHCVATMRSSDLWLGLPYDVFNFTQLTNSLAGALHVETGSFTITLGSAHLYQEHWARAEEIVEHWSVDSSESIRSPHLPGLIAPNVGGLYLTVPVNWTYDEMGSVFDYYETALAKKKSAEAKEVLKRASQLG